MDSSRVSVGVFLALVSLSAARSAAADSLPGDGWADPPLPGTAVRQAMQDRNYAEARKAIDEAAKAKDVPQDYLAYLKAWSFCLEKQYDGAVAALEQFEQQYPQSAWLRRARLAKGVALARKGDFKGAEAVFHAEAEYQLSAGRRQQLADVCLEFADSFFRPAKEGRKPDYERAGPFYAKALEVGLSAERRPGVELLVARCHQELGKHGEAVKALTALLAAYPSGLEAVEVRYRLGECLLAEGKRREARRAWQGLLQKDAGVQSERLAEAAYRLAATWAIPAPQGDVQLREGVAALEAFLRRYPAHKLAGRAQLDIAKSYLHRGRYGEAVAVLTRCLADPRYKDRPEVPDACNLLGQCYSKQKKYAEALATWREYLVKYPAQEAWSAVQQEIIDTEYTMGVERYKAGDYEAAGRLVSEFLAHHPLDDRNPAGLFLLGQMDYEQKKWDAAVAAWRRLISKHPHAEEAGHARFRIAQTLEQDLGKPDEALEAYRQVKSNRDAQEAVAAVGRLASRSMTLATRRVFRSSETPRLNLTTRNVESVTVRAYKLDLETYFRKTHAIDGIEHLDVSLIEPDATFEFKVPAYARYRQIESLVPVPLPDGATSGVMAVTVSTRSLEATTLVLQSDLEILVKSSPGEVFVFAENLRTGKPWPGARLLVSNGQQVIAEGVAEGDGVFRKAGLDLQDAETLRVFAAAGGHAAAGTVPAPPPIEASEAADRGYLYTDRPAYQPGQTVYVRGCVHSVKEGAHTIDKDRRYTFDVLDGRGHLLARQPVALSPFGTFGAEFGLPTLSGEGTYEAVVQDDAGHGYHVGFQVYRRQQEPVRLEIDLPRTVYCRDETIHATIRAMTCFDAPLVAQPVNYRLGSEPAVVARTDDRGEVHVKLPVPDDAAGGLSLRAELIGYGVTAVRNLTVATEGFSIAVSTPRPVVLAGETFEVAVKTIDAQRQPTAEKLTFKVLEISKLRGLETERAVEEHPLATGTEGTARQRLQLKQGGRYALRVEGADRFQNTIAARLDLTVSGDDDRQRLLLLVDRHDFQAGDTAEVQLYWREPPAPALVAFEAARVLEYRLVELKTGANRLAIPMRADLAPGFRLSADVLTDSRPTRLHHASTMLTIQRDLRVGLACRRKGGTAGPLRPGDTVEVAVTTTDPQGRPVAAEASLAMVPQPLLDRFPWQVPPVRDFFHGANLQLAVATASSAAFECRPETGTVDPETETDDQRQAAEEEAARIAEALEPADGVTSERSAPVTSGSEPFHEILEWIRAASQPESPAASPPAEHAKPEPEARKKPVAKAAKPDEGDSPFSNDPFADRPAKPRPKEPEPGEPPLRPLPAPADPVGLLAPIEPTAGGYWKASIVTGAEGRASIAVTLPENSATWTLLAKAMTTDTLVGEATERLVVKKDLAAELRAPAALVDGDEVEIGAIVSNDVVDRGPIEVSLRLTAPGLTWEDKKTIDVTARGTQRCTFKTAVRRIERPVDVRSGCLTPRVEAALELSAAAGPHRDTVRRSVPILPHGMPVFADISGAAAGDTTAWIEPRPGRWVAPTLRVFVSPSIERSLVDLVIPTEPTGAEAVATDVETAASDLMAAVAVRRLLRTGGEVPSREMSELDGRIRSALSLLLVTQNADRGWGWTGTGESQASRTASAVWAIHLARQAGLHVSDDAFDKALKCLRAQLSETDSGDYEGRAALLAVLAVAGRGDFPLANHLYRERASLSPPALAHLALALAHMDRKPTAAEVLELLAKQDAAGASAAGDAQLAAIRALALQQIAPKSPKIKDLVDWLLAHRSGRRWTPEHATGPAVLAIAAWLAENRTPNERSKLTVSVNGAPVGTVELDPAAASRVVDVPMRHLVKGRQRIDLQLAGRARYVYHGVLGGYVPADAITAVSSPWRITRTTEPAPLRVDGEIVPRGHSNVLLPPSAKVEKNRVTRLPIGSRATVDLGFSHKLSVEAAKEMAEGLVITEPIPAGASVVARSVRGDFDRVEILPGRLVFYAGGQRHGDSIHYELEGCVGGRYNVGPTILRGTRRTGPLAVSAPGSLAIVPAGAAADPYRLSPDELFDLGRRNVQQGDRKTAVARLTELLENWSLRGGSYQSTVEMLLDLHLAEGPAAKVVQYFEIVKERWPDHQIPFDKAVKVGAAYRDMGEFERAYLVARATVEGSFTRESSVAGFLEEQGEFRRSVGLLTQILQTYPPEPYLAEAELALAQRIGAKAAEAAGDPLLRKQKVDRASLVRRAWQRIEGFLTAYPDDPAADQAAFSAANALLDMADYPQAAQAAARSAARYPKSDLLDSCWYILAYCRFATGEHAAAIETCRKVADARRLDKKTGLQTESLNKWRAIYILGQIHESLGQAADAIREYRRVENRFPDAKLSIAQILRKSVTLPEATIVSPGKPAELELTFRNIDSCDVKTYRVDLMRLRRFSGLDEIAQVNLAGIRPLFETAVKLGDGKDSRSRTRRLPLPLAKEGAYLVVCRSGDLHSSGLLLVTPLELQVDYDMEEGQVRARVRDAATNSCLPGARVKILSPFSGGVVAGTTDFRGVFSAGEMAGCVTVLAQAGPGRFAFYRSPWPWGGSAMPMPGVARRPSPSAARAAPPSVRGERYSAADLRREPGESEQQILRALRSPTEMEFVNTPLKDVVDYLKDYHKIEIQLDTKELESMNISADTPVTKNLKGISLRSALRLILGELGLTHVIHNEVLMVTSPTRAETEEFLATKVYPVADLVLPRGATEEDAPDFDSLIDMMTQTVAPKSWEANGGPGNIAPFENKLAIVVSQTRQAHEEIEALLSKLRKVGDKASEEAKEKKPEETRPGAGAKSEQPAPRVPRRSSRNARAAGQGFGGMGGMGAGFFGGPPPGGAQARGHASKDDGLLEGLHNANSGFRDEQVQRLKKRYQSGKDMGGKGGMGAGGFF